MWFKSHLRNHFYSHGMCVPWEFSFYGFSRITTVLPLRKSVMNGMRTKSWTDQNFVRKIACRKVDANGVEYCFLRIILFVSSEEIIAAHLRT